MNNTELEYKTEQRKIFYRSLTNLLHIYWAMHKTRLNNQEIPFAIDWDNASIDNLYPEFDIRKKIEHESKRGVKIHPVLSYYAHAVLGCLSFSWLEFLEYKDVHDFIKMQISRINRLGPKVAISQKYESLDPFIFGGLGTGIAAMTQLAALSHVNPNLDPEAASLMISKVDFAFLDQTLGGIGIGSTMYGAKYDLIDFEVKDGINRDRLEAYGYRHALGCPAGNPPSRECRRYLQEGYRIDTHGTMIGELAEMISAQFPKYIGNWYHGNGPASLWKWQRRKIIDQADSALLEGRLPPHLKGTRFEPKR